MFKIINNIGIHNYFLLLSIYFFDIRYFTTFIFQSVILLLKICHRHFRVRLCCYTCKKQIVARISLFNYLIIQYY